MKNATLFIFFLFTGVLCAQYDVDLAGNFSYEYVSTNTDGTVKYNIKFHYAGDSSWTGMTTTTYGSYKKKLNPNPLPVAFNEHSSIRTDEQLSLWRPCIQ